MKPLTNWGQNPEDCILEHPLETRTGKKTSWFQGELPKFS